MADENVLRDQNHITGMLAQNASGENRAVKMTDVTDRVLVESTINAPEGVPVNTGGKISTGNSSTTPINTGANFTGEWEDVSSYSNIVIAVNTDQNGYYEIQFSPDGVNVDSTLTRYHRTNQIEPPHNFTITRRYARIVFYNNSGTNQTVFRLQTSLGFKPLLNIPLDGTVAQDFDAISTRPTDFQDEVVRGLRQGVTSWNKFGYRENLTASAGEQTIWAASGNYTPATSADTFDIAYDGTAGGSTDGASTTGALQLAVYYIDGNGLEATSVHVLGTDGSDTTSISGVGVNRIAVSATGSNDANASDIIITHTTSGNTMAFIPAGQSVTQQMIFHVGNVYSGVAPYLRINTTTTNKTANIVIKGYVYNRNVQTRYEIFRENIDTSVSLNFELLDPIKFRLSPYDTLYFVADTDTNGVDVNGRFSLNHYRNVDA
jgi:hypothetical protein